MPAGSSEAIGSPGTIGLFLGRRRTNWPALLPYRRHAVLTCSGLCDCSRPAAALTIMSGSTGARLK